jgi:hypothetical protein
MTTYNRPRPLSDLVPGLTKDIFGRKNMLFGKMAAEWVQVAGEEIAARTMPLDLKFSGMTDKRKGKKTPVDANLQPIPPVSRLGRAGSAQAVLHLGVQPGYALELSYQKALLIERLNVFFGYPAIKDIKIVQYSEVMNNKSLPKAQTRPITLQEERDIDDAVAAVQENDLQTALKNLGKSIVSRMKEGQ